MTVWYGVAATVYSSLDFAHTYFRNNVKSIIMWILTALIINSCLISHSLPFSLYIKYIVYTAYIHLTATRPTHICVIHTAAIPFAWANGSEYTQQRHHQPIRTFNENLFAFELSYKLYNNTRLTHRQVGEILTHSAHTVIDKRWKVFAASKTRARN